MSREQAVLDIENEDKNRSGWTRDFFKTDINDPKLYDIIIKIGDLTIDNACEIIRLAAKSDAYSYCQNNIPFPPPDNFV